MREIKAVEELGVEHEVACHAPNGEAKLFAQPEEGGCPN